MARISKTSFTAQYTNTAQDVARSSLKEKNDCAVIAVSVACGVSYEIAHATLKELGRKNGQGTFVSMTEEAIRRLGFRVERWTAKRYREQIESYPGVHKGHRNITTHQPRRFTKSWADTGTLLLRTEKHILACVDGVVHDWTINRSLRVKEVIVVTK